MATVESSVQSNQKVERGLARRKFIFLLIFLLLAVMFLAVGVAAFRGAGGWLVREDPIAPAEVIVVLSGGMPYRAERAAALYRGGYAPEVWVTFPESPAADLHALGISFVGEEEYDRQILLKRGVPENAVRILPDAIIDTEQEVVEIAREMHRTGKSRAIIVTSPEHTRRVRALWRTLAGNDLKLTVRAAFEEPYDARHWWRNSRDALSVVREYLGLLNAWAGLPVRPHTR